MSWIVASLLMLVCSIAMYLMVRKNNQLEVPNLYNNLAMFLIPSLIFGTWAFRTGTSLLVTGRELVLLLISAFLFAYLGNKFSLLSIKRAPNPGYSLIISKSYVVFTTIASVFLFHAALDLQSAMAIAAIILFSILVVVDHASPTNPNTSGNWLVYALGAFFCWGFLALAAKYFIDIGMPIITRLIYSMSLVSLFSILELLIRPSQKKSLTKRQMLNLVFIGLTSTGFNYFMQVAYVSAPNIGYVNAINAASNSLLAVFAVIVFKDQLIPRKFIGILGVTLGLISLIT